LGPKSQKSGEVSLGGVQTAAFRSYHPMGLTMASDSETPDLLRRVRNGDQ